jgi:radical SAM superfamily enzyme YgiQ (UPF0313 family)
MYRILLIKPDLSFGIEITPPLGLCSLAAVARTAGHEVRILDMRMPGQGESTFTRLLTEWRPDIVGFSVFSYEASAYQSLAATVRATLPQARIVVGGPFASADPEGALRTGQADLAVLGEGELVFIEALDCWLNGRDLHDLAGIATGNDSIVVNPVTTYIEDLDALPMPAWDLLDMDAYFHAPRQGFIFKQRNYFPVFSSRGCPYDCIYCHNVFGRRFRERSAASVLEEIEQLMSRYGVREIQFIDDIFNFRRDRAEAILQGIIDRGWELALSFPSGIRADLLDKDFIALLKRAGTYKVSVAIESGTGRLQQLMRKNLNLDKAHAAVRELVDQRILTHAFFMVGFPTETLEEARATAAFARTTAAHSASFFIVNPFKGTALAEWAEAHGKSDASVLGVSGYFDPRVADLAIADILPDDLRRLVRNATRDFYLKHPLRIWRILRDVPCKQQLIFLALLVVRRAFFPGALHKERRLLPGTAPEN